MTLSRRIQFARNDRAVCSGDIDQRGPADFWVYQRDDDTLRYTLDFDLWLEDDTISDLTFSASSTSVTGDSFTDTEATFLLHSEGAVDIKVITAGGQEKVIRICVLPRTSDGHRFTNDYYQGSYYLGG